MVCDDGKGVVVNVEELHERLVLGNATAAARGNYASVLSLGAPPLQTETMGEHGSHAIAEERWTRARTAAITSLYEPPPPVLISTTPRPARAPVSPCAPLSRALLRTFYIGGSEVGAAYQGDSIG